jgi:arginyl-tRNA synthetase
MQVLQGDVGLELGARVATALEAAYGVQLTPEEALVRRSSRDDADYQCNAPLSLGKKLKTRPSEVAESILAKIDLTGFAEPTLEISGPGFINITLSSEFLAQQAVRLAADERIGVPAAAAPRRIALDYSSPNTAKEMHVGHLRSTIIGDALAKILRFAGHEVIPHSHIGDWGTPFGMLIEHLLDEGWVAGSSSISDLNGFYQAARQKFDSDESFAVRARTRVVLLQGGDADTLVLWQQLVDESAKHYATVYDMLNVDLTPEDVYGESFYNPFLDETLAELDNLGLISESDGAQCAFPAGFVNRDKEPLPLIVRKSDGGYGYAATDLATIRYWTRERGATDLVYVVGSPQHQHFMMVFAVAGMARWLDGVATQHIAFGTILGEDGKTIRTRAGGSLKLIDLLTEAVENAAKIVAGRSTADPETQARTSKSVGIGAVKYADLSNAREKDYKFTWEKMLATEGNTSVYLQYANARINSILEKAGDFAVDAPILVIEKAERDLVLQLLELPSVIAATIDAYTPHTLCTYLYELATTFSTFYENCPILKAGVPAETKQSRLALAKLTSRTLVQGLALLGIDAPTRL